MLTFSPSLEAILKTASSKLDWVSKLNAALGNVRRVRCFRDSNATTVDPFLTGEEFLNIGNTGAISGNGGNISSFGTVSDATIRKAASLSTGKSILRIEGNGHWVQGSLGLKSQNLDPDSSKHVDFTMNANPTESAGFGMNASMRSPVLLASGTGPVAPVPDALRPVYFELEDWRNPAAPVSVKTSIFNVRDENLTFEDLELSQDMGDVRVTFLNESIVYDGFEFGAMLLSCNPVLNSESQETLHQVLVTCKPNGTWPSYPAMDTYNYFDAKITTSPVGRGVMSYAVYQPGAMAEILTLTAKDANTFSVTSSARGVLPDLQVITADDSSAVKEAKNYYGDLPVFDFYKTVPSPQYAGFWVRLTESSSSNPYQVGDKYVIEISKTFAADKPTDITTPSPFKAHLKRMDGSIIHTFQMRDGLPINSPLLSQSRTEFESVRPLFNCAMMLPWESHSPKMNTYRYKTLPRATADSWRPSMSQQGASMNGAVPLIYGRVQINSMNQYFAAPRWGIGYADNAANHAKDPNLGDPYVFNIRTYYAAGGHGAYLARAVGWDYEPGSISCHDWYTGPGGPRCDRQSIPTITALYMNNPEGIRARDNSTYRENLNAWNLAYFNHSKHYVTDVNNFSTIPTEEINAGKWSYSRAYYGGTDNYVSGGLSRHIAQWAIPNGSGGEMTRDRTGQPVWNGWAMDNLHAYASPEWVVLLFNNPMYVIAAKHNYNAVMLAQLLGVNPNISPGFLERNGAWRWLHWMLMWKIGTSHRLGVSRKEIEARWQKDMENIHDLYVVPATDPTHSAYNSMMMRTLRNLGQRVSDGLRDSESDYPNQHAYKIQHNGLAFYMSLVFLGMKTTGSWDVMYNKNDKCKKALEFMILCYDKQAVDMILDTKGRAEGDYPAIGPFGPKTETPPPVADSWAHWAQIFPAKGLEDWMHNEDGSMRGERDVGQHNRAVWAFMRRDYFPEFPYPRLEEACAEYQQYYDERAARVDAVTSLPAKRDSDWSYRLPASFIPVPPSNS